MYKIVILEDMPEHRERLTQLFKEYQRLHSALELHLRAYERALPLLTDYKQDADLMLLDIQVPDMQGMHVARKIRAEDERVMIIFVTSMVQYAVEGYEVNAFDYIVKPFSREAFLAKMDRAFRALSQKKEEVFLEVKSRGGTRLIPAGDITYVEVDSHDLLVHTPKETVRQWGSLKDCEAKLPASAFVRCNSCYLVNLKYVREIHPESVVVDQDELAISRPRRKEFLGAVAQYRGGSR